MLNMDACETPTFQLNTNISTKHQHDKKDNYEIKYTLMTACSIN